MSHQQPNQRSLTLIGPLTAHQAWDAVVPFISSLDATFRLTHIHSGTDFSADGRSKEWKFTFRLSSAARVHIDVIPCLHWDANDPGIPMCVAIAERPAPDVQRREHIFRTEPALPVPFRDTPEVAQTFEAQGIDLGAGPSDMMVQSAMNADGTAVWLIYYWDQAAFTTPLAALQSQ